MAKFDGPFGNFHGRMGNMVFYDLNGVTVGRTIGKVETITEKQDEVHMRTKVLSPFLKPLKEFLKIGFKNTPKPRTWSFSSKASSVNNPGAIKGKYPNLEMNYEKAFLSMGAIPPPKNPEVILNGKFLEFRWEPEIDAAGAHSKDQIMVVAFFPEKKSTVFITSGARRTEGLERLKLPRLKNDSIIETYIAYSADDRTDVSNSVYSGQLIWKGGKV